MRGKHAALYGLLTAVAMVLSYVESLVPLSFAVPGIKLGLPNIAVLFALYTLGFKAACTISLTRAVLVSVLFGSVLSLAYSLSGAAVSLAVMYLVKRWGRLGTVGVSVSGAVAHNAGQIAAAALLLETGKLAYYMPVLCVSGTVAGVLVGLTAAVLIKRIKLKG